MRLPLFALLALAAPAVAQPPLPFTVAESGEHFATLDAAMAALKGGDGTIRIAPGRYRDCTVQESGNVAFVAEVPGKAVFDGAICEGKATLVLRGRSSRVEGLVFTHMVVGDGNGAGIRMETGDLSVSDTMFVDGQCGILSAKDPGGTITIDRSTFSGLGKDPTGNGAHSIYIGDYKAIRITRSRFERGTGGHYFKSRAAEVTVVGNSFDDSRGHNTNYMIDLSNGATGRIANNVFVDGPDKENHTTMITVAPEGKVNSSAGLVIEHNTASLAPGFKWTTALVGDWGDEKPAVRDNTLARGIEAYQSRSKILSGLAARVRDAFD